MIPQLLEAKVIAAIEAALASVGVSFQIFGAWQPSAVGYLKNQQEVSTVATIAVAVGTQSRTTFTTGDVSFNGAVTLRVRAELDPTGQSLLAFATPIEALFRAWQGETYQQAFNALDVQGFQAGDISVAGNQPPVFDYAAKIISVTWSFTISGSDAV